MEQKRNKIRGAPIRQEKYEKYLQEQIPIWNAARGRRLEAKAELALLRARERRAKAEARLAQRRPFRANPVRVPQEVIGRLEALSTTEPNTGCWLWLGAMEADGYGRISVDGRMRRVHRVAFAAWVEPLPNGQRVLHRCDQPACINPEHLYAGSAKDNIDDALRRGRLNPVRVNGRFAKRD